MSSANPIAYVDIRAFAHATEDLDKVMTAIRNTLPSESIGRIVFSKTSLTGHHGNPIVLLETRIKDRNMAKAVLERLSSCLNILDKEVLGREIAMHLEKGNLYIRLDKQHAFLNEFKLGSTDPVHLRIHFKSHTSEEVVDICRKFGLLP